jgi:hypothetical protein
MVACRYALTYANSADISTHLTDTFVELQKYEIMTGTFLNYYAPQGFGGVMTCNPHNVGGPDFYHLRTPKAVWHHGEAMVTTNSWTDGTYTPSDEDFGADTYYNDESPKTHESHWNLLSPSLIVGYQRLSVTYRNREDMTIWADGRLDTGRTPRLEYEWVRLFDLYDGSYDLNGDGTVQFEDFSKLAQYWLQNEPSVDIAPAPAGDGNVDFKDLAVLAEHWIEQIAGIP